MLKTWLASLFAKCCKSLRRDERSIDKARDRLEKELDFPRLVKNNMLIANLLKHLTTTKERKLAKMQASKNVVVKDSGTGDGQSTSDFSSD